MCRGKIHAHGSCDLHEMNPSVEFQFINHVFNKLVEKNYFTHQRTVSGLKIRNRGDFAIFIPKNSAAK